MPNRKCCGTPRGKGSHKQDCPQGTLKPLLGHALRNQLDRDGVSKDARMAIVEDIGGDLPDGAFFALAQEFGIEPEDWIEEAHDAE